MTTAGARRLRLLEGMLEVVGEEGYAATSVRTVLGRTELYRQSFYDHFVDKEDCFLQAYDVGVERIQGEIAAAVVQREDWRGRLRAGLGAALEFLDRSPNTGRALIVEVHAAGPKAVAKRDLELERVARFLGQGAEADGDSTGPPSLAPEAIAAGIHSVLHSRLAARQDSGFARLLPEFMYIAVLPYLGVEAAAGELKQRR